MRKKQKKDWFVALFERHPQSALERIAGSLELRHGGCVARIRDGRIDRDAFDAAAAAYLQRATVKWMPGKTEVVAAIITVARELSLSKTLAART